MTARVRTYRTGKTWLATGPGGTASGNTREAALVAYANRKTAKDHWKCMTGKGGV